MKFLILFFLSFSAFAWDCEQKPLSEENEYIRVRIGEEYWNYTLKRCKHKDIHKPPFYEIDSWVYLKLLDKANMEVYGVFPSDPEYPIIVPDYRIREIKERMDMNPLKRFWIDLTK